MDIVKFNHTDFVTADVHFIMSLTMAAVKGYHSGRGLHVGHNCRAGGARGYRLDSQENAVRIPTGARNLFYSSHLSGPYSTGTQRSFTEVQSSREREADHLLPSSAEIKNAWIYTSLIHVVDKVSFNFAL